VVNIRIAWTIFRSGSLAGMDAGGFSVTLKTWDEYKTCKLSITVEGDYNNMEVTNPPNRSVKNQIPVYKMWHPPNVDVAHPWFRSVKTRVPLLGIPSWPPSTVQPTRRLTRIRFSLSFNLSKCIYYSQ